MRLWHIDLIPHLPRQQLLGQHRECCALRGKGWGKPHATVNYVFDHEYDVLYSYHWRIMDEMESRGYNVHWEWRDSAYRGKSIGYDTSDFTEPCDSMNYPEHNDAYLAECLDNLAGKGICIEMPTDINISPEAIEDIESDPNGGCIQDALFAMGFDIGNTCDIPGYPGFVDLKKLPKFCEENNLVFYSNLTGKTTYSLRSGSHVVAIYKSSQYVDHAVYVICDYIDKSRILTGVIARCCDVVEMPTGT